jgi:hypothetical protein
MSHIFKLALLVLMLSATIGCRDKGAQREAPQSGQSAEPQTVPPESEQQESEGENEEEAQE